MSNYYTFLNKLVEEGKTSGSNQSESMLHYTQMNLKRMKRWKKVGSLTEETVERIKSINTTQKWIVLTEAWCGDAAHSFMFIQKMADLNNHIQLEWKLRDENLDLMDKHLTNGGRSIPKLIVSDEKGNELFKWGPRPEKIQLEYNKMKARNMTYSDITVELQKLYNEDKGASIQKEIVNLLLNLN